MAIVLPVPGASFSPATAICVEKLEYARGFLPLLIIVGGDFWPSLAIVLAGGVGGSMILALVFVPAVYVLLNRENVVSQPDPAVTRNIALAGGAA